MTALLVAAAARLVAVLGLTAAVVAVLRVRRVEKKLRVWQTVFEILGRQPEPPPDGGRHLPVVA